MAERKRTAPQQDNSAVLESIGALNEKLSIVVDALLGKVGEDKPGLLERVRKLEEWVATEKKLIFIVVSTLVVDILTRIWNLVVR